MSRLFFFQFLRAYVYTFDTSTFTTVEPQYGTAIPDNFIVAMFCSILSTFTHTRHGPLILIGVFIEWNAVVFKAIPKLWHCLDTRLLKIEVNCKFPLSILICYLVKLPVYCIRQWPVHPVTLILLSARHGLCHYHHDLASSPGVVVVVVIIVYSFFKRSTLAMSSFVCLFKKRPFIPRGCSFRQLEIHFFYLETDKFAYII